MSATRRDFIAGLAATGAVAAAGCRRVPGAATVNLVAKAIGSAAGLVLNECDLPEGARVAVAGVVERILPCIPAPGQTLEEAWTPIAEDHVGRLVREGRISDAEGSVALAAFKLVVRAFALVERRHPEIRTTRELAEAAVSGFGDGLLGTLSPTSGSLAASVDVEAVGELRHTPEYRAVRGSSFTFRRRRR